jgi:hypothetical protein
MRYIHVVIAALGLWPMGALAQAEFSTADGARVQGIVIECAVGVNPVACGNSAMPLVVDAGEAASGSAMPVGGSGILGFLSGIYGILLANQVPGQTPPSASVTIAGPISVLPTAVVAVDCSVLVGATASSIIAPGTARKSFMLENTGSTNVGFSFTSSTPVLGGAQTFTLQPGGSYSSPPGLAMTSGVTAVAAAAGTQLACTYFN